MGCRANSDSSTRKKKCMPPSGAEYRLLIVFDAEYWSALLVPGDGLTAVLTGGAGSV